MARTMRDRELHVQICRFEQPAGQSANAQASPASPLGIILSPEKLIHSPRLRIYCQMLARGGVRFPGTDASMTEEKISEDANFREKHLRREFGECCVLARCHFALGLHSTRLQPILPEGQILVATSTCASTVLSLLPFNSHVTVKLLSRCTGMSVSKNASWPGWMDAYALGHLHLLHSADSQAHCRRTLRNCGSTT